METRETRSRHKIDTMADPPAADFDLLDACEKKGIANAQRWETALPQVAVQNLAASMAAVSISAGDTVFYEFSKMMWL